MFRFWQRYYDAPQPEMLALFELYAQGRQITMRLVHEQFRCGAMRQVGRRLKPSVAYG